MQEGAPSGMPFHVLVYGADHSPWVQTVLLALYLRKISHDVITFPPFSVFLKFGILMPAASFDGGPWYHESLEIVRELGFRGGNREEIRGFQNALRGGSSRIDSLPRFWYRWSLVRDRHPSGALRLVKSCLRAFTVLYYSDALHMLRRQMGIVTEGQVRRGFGRWQKHLEEAGTPFFGGATPNVVDLALFGGIQCHCSIPVPVIPVLQTDPDLARFREWIGAMHELCSGYAHLYSGPHFEPRRPAPNMRPLPNAPRSGSAP